MIVFFFGLTYIPVLYFGISQHFNNILLGDGARSLTFIWTVFLLTLLNIIYRIILPYKENAKFTKFLIRLNLEYGKIYLGLWLTCFIFIIQASIVNFSKISNNWSQDSLATSWVVTTTLSAFLLFPGLAVFVNYFLVKYFRRALWGPKL